MGPSTPEQARRPAASHEPPDDLIQAGYIGLLKAIGNFDPGVRDSQLGISQIHVSRLLTRALAHLRVQKTDTGRSPALTPAPADCGPDARPRPLRSPAAPDDNDRRGGTVTSDTSRALASAPAAPANGTARHSATGWREAAACRQADPELFFPVGSAGLAAAEVRCARAICAACPVRQPCLTYALATGQEFGIWGGRDEDERRQLRRQRRVSVPRP